ncbi:hypothetical protein E2C01_047440 [Portunus trituberculatus]|uniref:Uncharacterized protein n=1 Tax=Portunus trituberculatus TaxID=210409 RepID=A0A5B7G7X6_PORTR|nr:hypothetical protein [Portunus trituberculatus]
MGRYGMGHGAIAIRRERTRRSRRSSVPGDRLQYHPRPDNYFYYYNRHQQRKSSVGSSQSAPVKGSGEGGAATLPDPHGQTVVIPGQVPPSPLSIRGDHKPGGPPPSGPEWWPGPPLQQGGVMVPKQKEGGGPGLLADVTGLFSGMNTWGKIQSRLWPKDEGAAGPQQGANGDDGATKANHHVSFADEVGMWGWPRSPPSTGSERFLVFSPLTTHLQERRASGPPHCTGCSSSTPASHVPKYSHLI